MKTFHVTVDPLALVVTSITPTSSGVTIHFNKPFQPDVLNLYDAESAGLGAPDLTLTGASTGQILGSVIVAPGNDALTFIKTNGVLAPDTYTLTLRSASNGFKRPNEVLLDGDNDGKAGGNHVSTFQVLPSSGVTLSIPDFARGPGQDVNVPATGSGLPIRLSNGSGIKTLTFSLNYDPTLLTISGASLAKGIGGTLTVNTATPGHVTFVYANPAGLSAGSKTLLVLQATVKDDAPYTSKEVLDIADVQINSGAIPSIDDDGAHVVAYLGDTFGNGDYGTVDVLLISRVGVGLDTGFASYQLADPRLIGDISGDGYIGSFDSLLLRRFIVSLATPPIPALPTTITPVLSGGPDPKISLPTDLDTQPDGSLVVPLRFEQTDPNPIPFGAAEIVVGYDPSRFEVVGVQPGSVASDFWLDWRADSATGTLVIITAARRDMLTLASGTDGTLALIELKVKPDAQPGRTVLNLLADGTFGTRHVTTRLNEGVLTLVPAPTNATDDPGDGVITIRAAEPTRQPITATEVSAALVEIPSVSANSAAVERAPEVGVTSQTDYAAPSSVLDVAGSNFVGPIGQPIALTAASGFHELDLETPESPVQQALDHWLDSWFQDEHPAARARVEQAIRLLIPIDPSIRNDQSPIIPQGVLPLVAQSRPRNERHPLWRLAGTIAQNLSRWSGQGGSDA